MSEQDEWIESYADSTELLCEALGKAYMDANVSERHDKANQIVAAILTKDYTAVGLVMSELVYDYADEVME